LPPGFNSNSYIGSLGYLLPYIEQDNAYRLIPITLLTLPGTGGAWWGPGVTAANSQIKTFLCPSDGTREQTSTGTFVYFTTSGTTLTGGYFPTGTTSPNPALFGKTNYTACAGTLGNSTSTGSGGFTIGSQPDWSRLVGAYYVDSRTKIASIQDGTSNTFGYGEILGGSGGPTRDFNAAWMGAGAMPTAWATIDPAQWYTFGSKHTGIVLFGYCDGSVRPVKKIGAATDWYTARWYQFNYAAGAIDGQVYDPDQI